MTTPLSPLPPSSSSDLQNIVAVITTMFKDLQQDIFTLKDGLKVVQEEVRSWSPRRPVSSGIPNLYATAHNAPTSNPIGLQSLPSQVSTGIVLNSPSALSQTSLNILQSQSQNVPTGNGQDNCSENANFRQFFRANNFSSPITPAVYDVVPLQQSLPVQIENKSQVSLRDFQKPLIFSPFQLEQVEFSEEIEVEKHLVSQQFAEHIQCRENFFSC